VNTSIVLMEFRSVPLSQVSVRLVASVYSVSSILMSYIGGIVTYSSISSGPVTSTFVSSLSITSSIIGFFGQVSCSLVPCSLYRVV
jgi:hypothetical protein